MKKIELTLFFMTIAFLGLKMLLIPWSGALLAISLLMISCFYYFFGIALLNKISFKNVFDKSSYTSVSVFRMFFAIAIGWTYSLTIIGILFKLEFLQYGGIVLIVGIITIGVTSFISMALKYQTKSKYYNEILLRNLIIGGIGLFLFFYVLN